jgi:uncharacterized membrane protein
MRHGPFVLFLGTFLLCAGILCLVFPIERALLIGFDLAAGLFSALTLLAAARAEPTHLRQTASRDDGGRGILLLVAFLLVAVTLVAVGLEVVNGRQMKVEEVLLVILTLCLSWLFGNLVWARHYAHMFYDQKEGRDRQGLIFPGTHAPDLHDFIYFALVLGMTFQVSDVQIASSEIRRAATLHSVAAFFFNIGVVALTMNLIARGT